MAAGVTLVGARRQSLVGVRREQHRLGIVVKTGRFIDAFSNDHEPGAKLEWPAASICAALVAQACNIGYKPLVDEEQPGPRKARLRYVAQRYRCPETLAAANADRPLRRPRIAAASPKSH